LTNGRIIIPRLYQTQPVLCNQQLTYLNYRSYVKVGFIQERRSHRSIITIHKILQREVR